MKNLRKKKLKIEMKHTAGIMGAKTVEIIGGVVRQSIPTLPLNFQAFGTVIGRVPSQLKALLQHLAECGVEV